MSACAGRRGVHESQPLIAAVAVVRCGGLPAPSAGISFVKDFAGAHRRCARPHRGDGVAVVGSREWVGKTDVGAMKPEPDVDCPIREMPEVTSGPASQGANDPVSFLRQEGCAGETSLTATSTVPKPRRRK